MRPSYLQVTVELIKVEKLKNSTNTNEPFDAINSADYLIVSVLDEGKIGYFAFPKASYSD